MAVNKLDALLPGIRHNIPLKHHTTFRIGGPARYFFIARTKDDIVNAVKWAKRQREPFFILGEGSNLLVSDKGFNGLVIKFQVSSFKFYDSNLYADAGVLFSTLVREAGKRGLSGLEWAGGLPGTLGGAIRGNAGAFGGETKDTIVLVEALDENFKIRKLNYKQCQFGYRSSVFKKRGWVVLSARMKLKKGNRKKIQNIARDHIRYRKERNPLEYPNAGSIFKNCDLKIVPLKIQKEFRDVIKMDPFPVIPTAAIIARAGLKGERNKGAEVSEKHPNFIVNVGRAKADDMKRLIALVKKRVKNKYGIFLQEEIQNVGL